MAIPLLVCCILLACVFASVESQGPTAHTTGLLQCRVCTNALNLDDCLRIQTCSHDEQCFMDSIVTSSLEVVFNGGCRSTTVCNAGAHHTGKRVATDHVTCSACCNTTNITWHGECNTNLCGMRPVSDHSNQCYYCGPWNDAKQGAVTDPRKCRNIKICEDDEACSVKTINTRGILMYEFGCKQLLLCQVGNIRSLESVGVNTHIDVQHLTDTGTIVVGRKRQLTICDICCGDDLCNDDECASVRRRLAEFAKHERFNYTTLRLIF